MSNPFGPDVPIGTASNIVERRSKTRGYFQVRGPSEVSVEQEASVKLNQPVSGMQ